MRWYEWLLLWLAFFLPAVCIVPALAQIGGPLRSHPELQTLIPVLVPAALTLLFGFVNIRLNRRRRGG